MANEIKINTSIRLSKGSNLHQFTPAQLSLTQTGSLIYDNIHAIGTSEETAGPAFGDIGTEGLCVIHNLDATNYVHVGFATGVYGMRLYPLWAPAMFTLEPNATLYLKANTASCNVRVIVYEY